MRQVLFRLCSFFPASDLDPYYFRHLAKELGHDQPSFVTSAPPVAVEGRRLLSVEEIAARTVRAIRARQPQGAVRGLVGHCFGGVIALETARQLQAEGAEVLRLILVDALTPGYPKILASTARYMEQGLEAGRAALHGRLLFSPKEIAAHLRRLAFLALRGITARRHQTTIARGEELVKEETSTQVLLNRAMITEYSVPEIHIPIVHFMARDHKVDSRVLSDPRFGWRDFARAGLTEIWMPGDHNSLVMNEKRAGLGCRGPQSPRHQHAGRRPADPGRGTSESTFRKRWKQVPPCDHNQDRTHTTRDHRGHGSHPLRRDAGLKLAYLIRRPNEDHIHRADAGLACCPVPRAA